VSLNYSDDEKFNMMNNNECISNIINTLTNENDMNSQIDENDFKQFCDLLNKRITKQY